MGMRLAPIPSSRPRTNAAAGFYHFQDGPRTSFLHFGAMTTETPDSVPELMPTIEADQFFACDMRVAEITSAELLPKARVPAYKIEIDLGPTLGTRQSSAQLTERYDPSDLIGRRVIAVVNLPPRRVAGFKSEVLILGALPSPGDVSLLALEHSDIQLGAKIG